jgi:SEC-C motif-containing protein
MLFCPCGSQKKFSQCCETIITGTKKAETAEQLMRSRYTAYATKNAQYLFNTYATLAQVENSVDEIQAWADQTKWLKLTILSHQSKEQSATVEFIAEYVFQQKNYKMREKSRFIKENNEWRYLDGEVSTN